ncbi:Bax inhibitor-1 family protein [Pseudomonas sp. MAP12]|uniref:Bax inhibitor-1 family protein n=1 Tax=Geopseudomonas aromaticivorans TaxID=2849492 RepID=A0ABS6MYM0_9GAMM|nr:Bax inhibitor-1 family protein [Pseudomonas aromaticivorans]MBV2133912.1 Bax inhibitor-1 family protein [Pseudomonas aromaticivorans]
MDALTLYEKTFLILGSQLALTWLSTLILIGLLRRQYHAQSRWVGGSIGMDGKLDLHLDWYYVKPWFYALLSLNFGAFLILLFFARHDLSYGIPLFSLWSVLGGLSLALCLVSVDENLGGRVLGLTALITLAAGLVGSRSGIDFSPLREPLFNALLLLIAIGIFRLFVAIGGWLRRLVALMGIAVFTGYLLHDFHKLSRLNREEAANSWETAMSLAISIYLDVINLFLDLLDLLSTK